MRGKISSRSRYFPSLSPLPLLLSPSSHPSLHAIFARKFGVNCVRTFGFGLGTFAVAETIEVRWPSGTLQTLQQIDANQFLVIEEPVD